jgi:hypothetical protein
MTVKRFANNDTNIKHTKSQHDGGFGDEIRVRSLDVFENLQRLSVLCSRVTNEGRQPFDRFDVVSKNFKAGLGHPEIRLQFSNRSRASTINSFTAVFVATSYYL